MCRACVRSKPIALQNLFLWWIIKNYLKIIHHLIRPVGNSISNHNSTAWGLIRGFQRIKVKYTSRQKCFEPILSQARVYIDLGIGWVHLFISKFPELNLFISNHMVHMIWIISWYGLVQLYGPIFQKRGFALKISNFFKYDNLWSHQIIRIASSIIEKRMIGHYHFIRRSYKNHRTHLKCPRIDRGADGPTNWFRTSSNGLSIPAFKLIDLMNLQFVCI